MMTTQETREERGLRIAEAKEPQVNCVEQNFYTVKSQSRNGEYVVFKVDQEWACECPDNRFRRVKCKHIFAVETSIRMKEQVRKNVVIAPLNTSKCIYCGSEQIVKDAIRHNKKYDI